MKKDGLIKNERNYAEYLLFILEKIENIDKKLNKYLANNEFLFKDNKSILLDTKKA